MKDFHDLNVWRKAHVLTLDVYRATKNFPKQEMFGLTSQARRASASIGANIAEGCGRSSNSEFARFLYIAMGSASELQYHLLLSKDLGFLHTEDHACLEGLVEEEKRMLASLIAKVNSER